MLLIFILILIVIGLDEILVDVETAFQYENPYENLEEEIFMKCPPVIIDPKDEGGICSLNKCMVLHNQQDSIIRMDLKFCTKMAFMIVKLTLVCAGNTMKREFSVWP